MDRGRFDSRLARAAGRYGLDKDLVPGFVRALSEERVVIAPPRPKSGYDRNWGPYEYRRILEAMRYRRHGASELAIIRWLQWLRLQPVPIFDDGFDVISRKALARAFVCLKNQLCRGVFYSASTSDPGRNDEWRKAKLREHLSGTHPSLAALAECSPQGLADAFVAMKFGGPAKALEADARRLLAHLPIAPLTEVPPLKQGVQLTAVFDGFLASSEYREGGLSPPEKSIFEATERTYGLARHLFNLFIEYIGGCVSVELRRSLIFNPSWRLLLFVLLLHQVHLARGKFPDFFDLDKSQ